MNIDKIKKKFIMELVESLYTDERIIKYGDSEVINQIVKKWEKFRVKNIPDSFLSRPIYESEINVLKNLEKQFWIRYTKDIGLIAKQNIIFACLGSVSEWDMIKRIRDSTNELSKAEINILTNTSLRTMSRTVFAFGAQVLPDSATFIYTGGAIIPTSRDFCIRNYGQSFTKEEAFALINDQGGQAMTDGGGFNCMHGMELEIEL